MIRGTTPRHIFTLPDTMADVEFAALYVTYMQRHNIVLEKTLADVQRDGVTLTVHLTQAETLAFERGNTVEPVYIQIRAKTIDDDALASEIIKIPVEQILRDGEI